MTLYEINGNIQYVVENLTDPETGEVREDMLSLLADYNIARDSKIEDIACAVKNLRADSAAIKTEADKLNERRHTLEAKADRLERYLAEMLGGEKFKSARVAIGQRTSKAVSVENEEELVKYLAMNGGQEALRHKPTELRKDVLRKWLDMGIVIPGCSIEERHSITIR